MLPHLLLSEDTATNKDMVTIEMSNRDKDQSFSHEITELMERRPYVREWKSLNHEKTRGYMTMNKNLVF